MKELKYLVAWVTNHTLALIEVTIFDSEKEDVNAILVHAASKYGLVIPTPYLSNVRDYLKHCDYEDITIKPFYGFVK